MEATVQGLGLKGLGFQGSRGSGFRVILLR